MKRHTRIYLDFFGYFEGDIIPCEICKKPAVDIHHIDARGMGGSKHKDTIENLMALCRQDHIDWGDKKQFKDELKKIHNEHINNCKNWRNKGQSK